MYQNQLQSTFTLIFKTPNTPLNPTFSETNSTHSLLYPLTTFNSKSQQTPLNLAFSETNSTHSPIYPLTTFNSNPPPLSLSLSLETNSTHSLLYPLTTFNSKQPPLNQVFPTKTTPPSFSYLSSNHFQLQTSTDTSKPSLTFRNQLHPHSLLYPQTTFNSKSQQTPPNPNLPHENNSTHSPIYPLTTFNSKSQQTPLNLAFPRNQLHTFSSLPSNHFQLQTDTSKPSLPHENKKYTTLK